MNTYQEKRISHKRVPKNAPPNPPSRPLTSIQHGTQPYRHNDPDKLVAGVSDEVVDLALGADVEEVAAEPEDDELEDDDDGGVGEGDAEELGLEFAVQAGDEGGEEDVGYEGHGGDVHVWAVIVSTWIVSCVVSWRVMGTYLASSRLLSVAGTRWLARRRPSSLAACSTVYVAMGRAQYTVSGSHRRWRR